MGRQPLHVRSRGGTVRHSHEGSFAVLPGFSAYGGFYLQIIAHVVPTRETISKRGYATFWRAFCCECFYGTRREHMRCSRFMHNIATKASFFYIKQPPVGDGPNYARGRWPPWGDLYVEEILSNLCSCTPVLCPRYR